MPEKYVPAMERNAYPTAVSEMSRLIDECARLAAEVTALRTERRAADSAAMELANTLCVIRSITMRGGAEVLPRDQVMEAVVRWRMKWDAIGKGDGRG